eukprot:TRINITY_DN22345_c0_g1_i1.p1 TRINITY_DN22345_c0_g1~~TRINITY_DN22345_c0_g1_i1.p1  ORF type:complete len:845 (-),score=157.90 TRINITY_DN22345_c0_g1_i1:41-2575(-)
MARSSVRICHVGGSGLFFPAFGDEATWPRGLRIALYSLALMYSFLGIAMVSDIFMTAIETITSRKIRVVDKRTKIPRTVKVWNDTVANLTLMALGSSAPEILLGVIEILKEEMYFGELGPGTIVGSAAFNLLGISAVCVAAIPSPDVRMIKDLSVFAITAAFSIFAYLWLIIILQGISVDRVEVWEAVLTLLFFPVLVALAFCADRGWFGGGQRTAKVGAENMSKEELAELLGEIKAEHGEMDLDTAMTLLQSRAAASKSKAEYRIQRSMTKRMKAKSDLTPQQLEQKARITALNLSYASSGSKEGVIESQKAVTIDFAASHYACREGDGKIVIKVNRCDGAPNADRVFVRYRTMAGTASAGSDFVHTEGLLLFEPGTTEQDIVVQIIDDTDWEAAENFQVELLDLCATTDPWLGCRQFRPGMDTPRPGFEAQSDDTKIIDLPGVEVLQRGPFTTTTVTIIDDDDPGALAFRREFMSIEESSTDMTVSVEVVRNQGSRGRVLCKCHSEDDSAVAPLDYEAVETEIVFDDGDLSKQIEVTLKARGRFENTERFRLVLSEPQDGCRLDADADGGLHNVCWIEIKANTSNKDMVERMVSQFALNLDKTALGFQEWKEQFTGAIMPEEGAGAFDWMSHLLTMPWKLSFALIPPSSFGNGWWCFFAALVGIGLLTAAVGDLAALLGCTLCLPDQITAITFVALGTSLPDTFASKSAAMDDPYADASIGNITGSNSVNVFLGLGISWTIGSIYWATKGADEEWLESYESFLVQYPEGGFIVEAGNLGFSVGVFLVCALACLALLFARRKLCGGELGGPCRSKVASAVVLVILWLAYIAASWLGIDERLAC